MSAGPRYWDIEPEHELLDPPQDRFDDPLTFKAACLNAHGMYETMRFVLRLSPRNHELLDSIDFGTQVVGELTNDQLQAYATYLHETVHWWQHIGSTSGLLLSLSYLAQTHSSLGVLRETLARFGPKKSLKGWADKVLARDGHAAQATLAPVNIAVNNTLDVEYYKAFAFRPRAAAHWLTEQPHFESIGHSYYIAYGQLVGMVAEAVDPSFSFLPDGANWDVTYRRLREQKVQGFYWRSPIVVPPIGLHAIYEGQARFIQLQFLILARENPPSIDEWRDRGFLSGIYVEAFEWFLQLTDSTWPATLSDPIVSLFLLVCDLAINPTRGFPLEIECFEKFIDDVDVGLRFVRLCRSIKENPNLKNAIKAHSRDEYVEISAILATSSDIDPPLIALEMVVDWITKLPGPGELMEEHRAFEYGAANMPVRLLVSHFFSFTRDRLQRPEFFCWPAVWMAGEAASPEVMPYWLRHLSLFSDRGDKPGVYPRNWPDREPEAIKRTFETFYGSMAVYDLTRQWILFDGPFNYDFEWLMETYSQDRADAWATKSFEQVYGVAPTDFEFG